MEAVSSSGHRERREISAVNRSGRAWNSGVRLGSGSLSRWAGNPSEARRRQLLTTLTHNRHLVEAPEGENI